MEVVKSLVIGTDVLMMLPKEYGNVSTYRGIAALAAVYYPDLKTTYVMLFL